MNLIRVTTRQLMACVALVAVAIWLNGVISTFGRYDDLAKRHAASDQLWRESPNRVRVQYERPDGTTISQDIIEPPGKTVTPDWAVNMKIRAKFDSKTMADYHARQKRKYERARWHPSIVLPAGRKKGSDDEKRGQEPIVDDPFFAL